MTEKEAMLFAYQQSAEPMIKNKVLRDALDKDLGPRNTYAQGQLVSNTVDGSRPGYDGTNAKTGEGFQKGHKFGRDLKGKPSLNVGGKNQHTGKQKTAKEIQAIIDANPNYITPKNFYEPTKNMQEEGMKKLLQQMD